MGMKHSVGGNGRMSGGGNTSRSAGQKSPAVSNSGHTARAKASMGRDVPRAKDAKGSAANVDYSSKG